MESSEDGSGRELAVVKAGPCGNLRSGEAWEEAFPGFIDKIFLSYGRSIRSIQMVYRMVDGKQVLSAKHGGRGCNSNSIQFENGECIEKISGHLSYWMKNVKSLTIVTDRRTFGPYGQEEGTPFEYSVHDGFIRGLHGRSNKKRLKAIGVLFGTGIVRWDRQTEDEQQTPPPQLSMQTSHTPPRSPPPPPPLPPSMQTSQTPPRSPPPVGLSSSKSPAKIEETKAG